jgi:hypothetical protein
MRFGVLSKEGNARNAVEQRFERKSRLSEMDLFMSNFSERQPSDGQQIYSQFITMALCSDIGPLFRDMLNPNIAEVVQFH